MPKSTITFRDQTSGRLTDFLADEGLDCAQTLGMLAYLVGALVNYKEEGVELTPTILICDNLSGVLKAIPGAISYEIGTSSQSKDSGSRILKECGVLASGNWFIYIERALDLFRFGVAAYPVEPQSVTLRDALGIGRADFSVVLRRIAQSTVEVVGGKGNELTLVFSTVREAPVESAHEAVGGFAASCCNGLTGDGVEGFQVFFAALLLRVLEASHGTILVCFKEGCAGIDELKEVVSLQPCLDFFNAFDEHRVSATSETLIKLQNFESLLAGLLKADGVVTFSDTGTIIGYRAFFRPAVGNNPVPVIGGARRRAFEGICQCIGNPLMGALFRSQDGLTIYRRG